MRVAAGYPKISLAAEPPTDPKESFLRKVHVCSGRQAGTYPLEVDSGRWQCIREGKVRFSARKGGGKHRLLFVHARVICGI